MNKRRFVFIALLAVLLLLGLMLWSLCLGAVAISARDVAAISGFAPWPVSEITTTIVTELRLPRTLLAALTGAGLAMTGALLQTTTRNELADPFLFGLSSGARQGRYW